MNYNEVKSNVREYLTVNHLEAVNRVYDSSDSKNVLKEATEKYLVNTEYTSNIKETTNILFNDLFGLGIIEDIILDESITDISFNGHKLWVQSNKTGRRLYERQISSQDAYIIIEKIANQAQKPFNIANPILDVEYDTIRVNAVHESISPDGRSFAIRIIRQKIQIDSDNLPCDKHVIDFLNECVSNRKNIIISGQTGSGKSELQKYLINSIDDKDKIVLISDNNELKLSRLYPQKDIYTWITKAENFSLINVSFSDLIKPALRYNPEWLIISESRGKESFDMINAATTGHSIITTLHAQSATDIPTRLLNMCTQGNINLNDKTLIKNIYHVLDIGIHLITKFTKSGNIIRIIDEIVLYNDDETVSVIFKLGAIDEICNFS